MKGFIGLVNYFRDHIREASLIMQPLEKMVTAYKPKELLVWTEVEEKAFEEVKMAVHNCPLLFLWMSLPR